MARARSKSAYGRELNLRWMIGARQARYHFEGKFYMMLHEFPGALCDPRGFVLFESKEEFVNSGGMYSYPRTARIFVSQGISSLAGYQCAPAGSEVDVTQT